jgi:hypothetical protein
LVKKAIYRKSVKDVAINRKVTKQKTLTEIGEGFFVARRGIEPLFQE